MEKGQVMLGRVSTQVDSHKKCRGVDGNHYLKIMSITESSEWVCADGWSPK
jgi:hypothetical protein